MLHGTNTMALGGLPLPSDSSIYRSGKPPLFVEKSSLPRGHLPFHAGESECVFLPDEGYFDSFTWRSILPSFRANFEQSREQHREHVMRAFLFALCQVRGSF